VSLTKVRRADSDQCGYRRFIENHKLSPANLLYVKAEQGFLVVR
jgi:hypothetical protein